MKLRYLLVMAALSIGLLALDEDLAAIPILAMIGVLAVAMALRLRPSLRDIWPSRRLPRPGEAMAVVVGTVLAVVAMGLLGWGWDSTQGGWSALTGGYRSIDDPVGHGLLGLALAVAFLPSALWLRRPRAGDDSPVPLWPCAVSLLAALPLGLAANGVWQLLRQKLLAEHVHQENIAEMFVFLPPLMLWAGAAGLVWWRAFRAEAGDPFDSGGILGAGLNGARVAFAITIVIALVVLSVLPVQRQVGGYDAGSLVSGLVFATAVIAAWLVVFRGLDRMNETNVWVALAALVALVLPLIFSFALPAGLMSAREWVGVGVVFGLPVLAVVIGLILALGWLIRLVSRHAGRFTISVRPHPRSTG